MVRFALIVLGSVLVAETGFAATPEQVAGTIIGNGGRSVAPGDGCGSGPKRALEADFQVPPEGLGSATS